MPFDSNNTARGSIHSPRAAESATVRYRLSHDVLRIVDTHARKDVIAAMKAEAPHLWQNREPQPGNRAIARAAAARRAGLQATALQARVKSGMGQTIHCLPFGWAGHNLAVASFFQEASGCLIIEIGALEHPCQAIAAPVFPPKKPKKKRPRGHSNGHWR